MGVAGSPDQHGFGLTEQPAEAMRYDGHKIDPWETSGLLRKRVPAGARILDIGCGTGSMTIEITRDHAGEVVGVEPDPARAQVARERGLNVFCGLADESFFRSNGRFDVIIFSDVLEHLSSPGEMITASRAALTPDGKILASIPNVAHWTVRMRLLLGNFDYRETGLMDSTHLRWFTSHSVRQLFERCGFDVIGSESTAGTWMPEYRELPFRLAPHRVRNHLVRRLSRSLPGLFGCQHIVEAVPRR